MCRAHTHTHTEMLKKLRGRKNSYSHSYTPDSNEYKKIKLTIISGALQQPPKLIQSQQRQQQILQQKLKHLNPGNPKLNPGFLSLLPRKKGEMSLLSLSQGKKLINNITY